MHKEENQRPYVILWVAIQMRAAMDLWYISEQGEREKGNQKEAYRGVTSLHNTVEGWHTGFKMNTSNKNASK